LPIRLQEGLDAQLSTKSYRTKGLCVSATFRELVTIIEMLASSSGATPLSKAQSAVLRDALKNALNDFAAKEDNSDNWRQTIEQRIDYINSYDAKTVLRNFISKLPPGIVSVQEGFNSDVIEFRNTLVHDMTRVKNGDYNKLSFFVAKLKALYALSDAVSLGARVDEIRSRASFFVVAENASLNSFCDDVE
jgi:hypothetical protein